MLDAYYLIGGFYWIVHCIPKHSTTKGTWSFQTTVLLFAKPENVRDSKTYKNIGLLQMLLRTCLLRSFSAGMVTRWAHFTGCPSPMLPSQENTNWGTVRGPPPPLWIYKRVSLKEEWFLPFEQLEVYSQWLHPANSSVNPCEAGRAFCRLRVGVTSQLPSTDLQEGPWRGHSDRPQADLERTSLRC